MAVARTTSRWPWPAWPTECTALPRTCRLLLREVGQVGPSPAAVAGCQRGVGRDRVEGPPVTACVTWSSLMSLLITRRPHPPLPPSDAHLEIAMGDSAP